MSLVLEVMFVRVKQTNEQILLLLAEDVGNTTTRRVHNISYSYF